MTFSLEHSFGSGNNDMKDKFRNIAGRYTVCMLAFLPLLPVLRFLEYYYLSRLHILPEHILSLELTGLLNDLLSFFCFVLILFIPVLLVSLLNKTAGMIFCLLFLILVTILQFSLIRYFAINVIPLDNVIFSYSYHEVLMIVRNSENLGLLTFLPVILLVLFLLLLQLLFRRIKASRPTVLIFAILCLASVALSFTRILRIEKYESDVSYYLTINKTGFFVKDCIRLLLNNREKDGSASENPAGIGEEVSSRPAAIKAKVEIYHDIHREFDFIGEKYPLMHRNDPSDVLGSFFNLKDRPPNIVFVVVESLTPAFIGNNSYYGNFTPFLDSLIQHSLYWDNFLSVSERTFHVFAGMLGSLPFGNGEFEGDMGSMPYHISLLRWLKMNGYYTSFFYGGDPTFTNYDQFFKKQETDFILRHFGPAYGKSQLSIGKFLWGYQDGDLFNRSLEVLDSLKKEPRADIYLTLSMHHPFHPPNAAHYIDEFNKIVNRPDFPEPKRIRAEKYKEIFSSILYTDESLRQFFKEYSTREDFSNTIFVITGDHFFHELSYPGMPAIEHYHVPLIIYSPMLNHAVRFSSVSSHLDITPSVYALLKDRYGFPGPSYISWLGKGIDTARHFRNINTLNFVTMSWTFKDYLEGNYFYSNGRLYRIADSLKTNLLDDEKKRVSMIADLGTTVSLYKYVNRNNLLTPPELYLAVNYKKSMIFRSDTVNREFKGGPIQFINFNKPYALKSNYLQLLFDISFKYWLNGPLDSIKVPSLIVSLDEGKNKTVFYHKFRFPGVPCSSVPQKKWISYRTKDLLDVSSIADQQGKLMKVYFYNEFYFPICYDSLSVTVTGIK